MHDYQSGIENALNKNLKEKIVTHRERFKYIFRSRYQEMLPALIKYKQSDTVAIDFYKVEVALRSGFQVVIGTTVNNNVQVIGWLKNDQTQTNPEYLFNSQKVRHGDIQFVIPLHLRHSYYKEITHEDSCQSGNFVVLRNKTVNRVDDWEILDHYVDELAEIVMSRYSISMQVKISTLFLGEPNDESINQLVSDIYNGNPYIKATKNFDPLDQIYHMQNTGMAQNFQELKREYQNKISELNNALGIQSLAVEKASGVSDEEAKSNRGFTTSNANIYLDGRNNGLKRLNKRFNLHLEAVYNDEVTSEFSEFHKEIEKEKDGGGDNGGNSDTV